jgi:hypothetical protein
MRRLFRLALLAALAAWVWRALVSRRATEERVGVFYANGCSLVLEPGSAGFERLVQIARSALSS